MPDIGVPPITPRFACLGLCPRHVCRCRSAAVVTYLLTYVDWVYDRIDVIGLHVHVRWVKLTIGLTLETYVRPCAGCCATGGIHPSHHPSGSE